MSTAAIDETPRTVVRKVVLTPERSRQLEALAQSRFSSEDQVIEQALDLYFHLTDFFGKEDERRAWQSLSEASLSRVWENKQDAAYDNWRDLYGLSER